MQDDDWVTSVSSWCESFCGDEVKGIDNMAGDDGAGGVNCGGGVIGGGVIGGGMDGNECWKWDTSSTSICSNSS